MADMKPQTYKDDRPAEYFDQFHASARKGVGWTYTFVRIILSLPTLLIYRVRAIGVENVPKQGALILAPNHFSQMDHFFIGLYLRRKVRFMAKSQMFGPPVLTYIYKHGGVFPVRRGNHDEEAIKTAATILSQGEMLLVYAEGGRSRSGKLKEVKPGIGRIALESGATVVPVAIQGFTALVIGGVGRVEGALLGGLVLAFVEQLGARYLPIPSGLTLGFPFLLLILFLFLRPSGLISPREAR